jgi:hypothetical protein
MSYSAISAISGMNTGTVAVADPTGGVSSDGISSSYAMQEQLLAYYESPFWGTFFHSRRLVPHLHPRFMYYVGLPVSIW